MKGKRTREPLTQCRDLRSDHTIRNSAIAKVDERMLAIVSRELVAAEAHYHRSCYREYVRGATDNTPCTSDLVDDNDTIAVQSRRETGI